ncbi:MAG: adaptor protein MecA [Oscillospiraceae bacterium]|nr:adaptor protein MecA [Oscillospiraceae bacterium]
MELLLISDSKLKVMLSPRDMAQYELTCENIDYDNTETRRAFWNILNEAKHQTGFDAAADRVFIQVYPSKGGGCEIFVTKIDVGAKGGRSPKNESATLAEKKVKSEKPSVKSTSVSRRKLTKSVFRFDDMGAMLSACYHLENFNSFVSSSAFASKGSKHCYLSLEWEEEQGDIYENNRRKMRFAPAMEYGEQLAEKSSLAYIHEHCQCISPYNAIEALAGLCK